MYRLVTVNFQLLNYIDSSKYLQCQYAHAVKSFITSLKLSCEMLKNTACNKKKSSTKFLADVCHLK